MPSSSSSAKTSSSDVLCRVLQLVLAWVGRRTVSAGPWEADLEGVLPVKLVCDPVYGEVDLSASAEELNRLASAVGAGEGLLSSTSAPGSDNLAGVEVRKGSGPGVRIH